MNNKLISIVVVGIMTAICSCLIVVFFFGGMVFDMNLAGFGILVRGAIAGIVFASFRKLPLLTALIVTAVCILAALWLSPSTPSGRLYFEILYVAMISGAVYIYAHNYYDALSQHRIGRALVLAGLLALSYFVVSLVVDAVFLSSSEGIRLAINRDAYYSVADGFFLGIGVGCGIEMSGILIRKINRGEL